MRIGLGLILLADWLIRLNSLSAHYTSAGVLPLQVLYDYQWKEGFYSLFLLSDAVGWCYFLFFTAILFSIFFAIGYFTRFSALVVWILLCSVHVRQPFVLQGGDELLRIALFWSLFLPLGSRYSVDAVHSVKDVRNNLFSASSVGFMILVFSVYFFSALLKNSSEWQSDGTAIYYALSLDQMVLPLGKVLLKFPLLCKLLTHVVYWTELLAPVLFFIPYKNRLFRTIGIILLLLMHAGIGITLFVGLFFLIGMVTLVGLLPGSFMDRLVKKTPSFIKTKNGFPLLAAVLPSFGTLRNLYERSLKRMTNFYTETIITFSLIFIMCICLIWNIGNISGSGLTVSGPFRRLVFFLRIDQNWGMFSPGVFKDDGWFVLEGSLNGSTGKIDIYRNHMYYHAKPLSYDKPANVLEYIKDDRWRKYEENYIMVDYSYIRPYYCEYLLKDWNRRNKRNTIDTLKVIYMKERTLPDYKSSVPEKEVLCTCTNKQ